MLKTATVRFKDLGRWDVKTYMGKLSISHYALVPFGALLKKCPIQFEELKSDKEYPIIGVRSYGKGLFHNRIAKGKDIITPSTKAYQKIEAGNLFWCKVDTKNGAFGITQPEHIGYYASNNMIQVRIQQDKIHPSFLQLLFTFDFFQQYLDSHVVGLTNRQYISFTELVNISIPLPSLDEQKRIVALWQEAETEAEADRQEAARLRQDIDAYLMAELGITIQKQKKAKVFTARLKDLERWDVGFNLYPQYHFKTLLQPINSILTFEKREWKNSYGTTFPYIQISDVNKEDGIFNHTVVDTKNAPSRAKTLVKTGDLLLSLTRPNLGAFAIIDSPHNNFVATSGFAVCNGRDIVENYFIMFLLQSSFGINLFNKHMTGALYPAISQEDLGNLKIPLPPMAKQQEIVGYISQLRGQIAQLQKGAQDRLDRAREQIKKMILI